LASALRERRSPDQERTKSGYKKNLHIDAALPAANERASTFAARATQTLMWIKVKTTGFVRTLCSLNGQILSSGVRALSKSVAIEWNHEENYGYGHGDPAPSGRLTSGRWKRGVQIFQLLR
jgi:hypothetical protein